MDMCVRERIIMSYAARTEQLYHVYACVIISHCFCCHIWFAMALSELSPVLVNMSTTYASWKIIHAATNLGEIRV